VWRGPSNRRSQRRDTAPLAERDGVVKAKPGDSLAVDAVIMEFA
jgi:hypothetical protein